MSTLCRDKQDSEVITTGRVKLNDTKREKIFGYGVNILSDVGGQFFLLGTIKKTIEEMFGKVIRKWRRKRHEKVAEATYHSFRFILKPLVFSNLIDCE